MNLEVFITSLSDCFNEMKSSVNLLPNLHEEEIKVRIPKLNKSITLSCTDELRPVEIEEYDEDDHIKEYKVSLKRTTEQPIYNDDICVDGINVNCQPFEHLRRIYIRFAGQDQFPEYTRKQLYQSFSRYVGYDLIFCADTLCHHQSEENIKKLAEIFSFNGISGTKQGIFWAMFTGIVPEPEIIVLEELEKLDDAFIHTHSKLHRRVEIMMNGSLIIKYGIFPLDMLAENSSMKLREIGGEQLTIEKNNGITVTYRPCKSITRCLRLKHLFESIHEKVDNIDLVLDGYCNDIVETILQFFREHEDEIFDKLRYVTFIPKCKYNVITFKAQYQNKNKAKSARFIAKAIQ